MKRYCSQCQAELPGDAKFCAHCGAALAAAPAAAIEYCTQCGSPRSAGAAYCAQCGAASRAASLGQNPESLVPGSTETGSEPSRRARPRPLRKEKAPKRRAGASAAVIAVLLAILGLAAWQFGGDDEASPITQPARSQASANPPGAALDPQLSAARAERDAAFERYTRLATDSTQPGDRESALAAYREANARFQALTAAASEAGSAAQLAAANGDHGVLEAVEGERNIATIAAPGSVPTRMLTDLQSSARAGDAGAQTSLALIYQTGAEADPARAIELLESAAAAGDADAMNALADAYSEGVWVRKDARKAQSLRRKAAEAGSRLAQWELEL